MPKKKESNYTSWDEVNEDFKKLASLKVEKEKLEGKQTLEINEIKAKISAQAKVIATEIKTIEDNITRFAEIHRDEFVDKRSKKLQFGTISFRYTKKIICKSIETAIKALKALNLDSYLRVKEELDKEKLLELDEALLTKAGLSIKREDSIKIEPDFIKISAQ